MDELVSKQEIISRLLADDVGTVVCQLGDIVKVDQSVRELVLHSPHSNHANRMRCTGR